MPQWALIASAAIPWDYARAKMINTGPFSKGSKSPGTTLQGNFNYLDICWVTDTAVMWTLNYVRTVLLSGRWKHTGDEVTLTWLEGNRKCLPGSFGFLCTGGIERAGLLQQGGETDRATGQYVLMITQKKPTSQRNVLYLFSEAEVLVNNTARATLSHKRREWILISESTFEARIGRWRKEAPGYSQQNDLVSYRECMSYWMAGITLKWHQWQKCKHM